MLADKVCLWPPLLALCAAASATEAFGQSQTVVGDCSPAIIQAQNITINCPGVGADRLEPLLSRLDALLGSSEDRLQFLTSLIDQHRNEDIQQFSAILELAVQQLYQTARLTYALGYADVPLSLAVRFPADIGAFSAYGARIDALAGASSPAADVVDWPSIYPFSDIVWQSTESAWFPTSADGPAASAFTSGMEIRLQCYGPGAGAQASAVKTMADLNNLPVPLLGETVSLDPHACGVGFAAGDPEHNIVLRGDAIHSEAGSVHKSGAMTSVLDLFGGVCFVVLQNTAGSDETIANMKGAWLLSLLAHFSPSTQYGASINTNFAKLEGSDYAQLYRWTMPTAVEDLDTWPSIGDFTPVPQCGT